MKGSFTKVHSRESGERALGGRWLCGDFAPIARFTVLLARGRAMALQPPLQADSIHYDRKYVTEVEGYPGLIVHGPLIATLLLDLLRRELPQADVASFRFKAIRPAFDRHPFRVNGALQSNGKTVRLWAQDNEGWLTMDATTTLR